LVLEDLVRLRERPVVGSDREAGRARRDLDESVDAVVDLMAKRQVRRVPIVDSRGAIVGIVSQADIATRLADAKETGEVVQAISEPSST
jgi:CBS-domain-containing membrane protein